MTFRLSPNYRYFGLAGMVVREQGTTDSVMNLEATQNKLTVAPYYWNPVTLMFEVGRQGATAAATAVDATLTSGGSTRSVGRVGQSTPGSSDDYFWVREISTAGGAGSTTVDANLTSASGGTVIIKQSQNGVGFNGGSFARPSGATWHHGLFTFDRNGGTATQETVFIDGVSQTISQASSAPVAGNFDNSTLFLMSRNGGSLFGAGRIADLALWGGVLLTASDATALFATVVFPQEIYRDNLVGYWPMCGAENPEPDQSRTNADMTMTGTTRSRHLRDNPYCFFPATMIPLSALE